MMAILRQKKRNLILAALAGMLLIGIPALVGSGILIQQLKQKSEEVTTLRQQMEEQKEYKAYCFKSDKSKGERIQAEDLQEITLKTKSSFAIPEISDLEGRYLSVGIKAGVIITDSVIHEDKNLEDDVRTYLYDYIILPEGISRENLFDIRIRFPNGEDYVVAVGKKVESLLEQGAFINASEEENLLLSSAYVDTMVYEGTKIYAALYVEDYQKAAVANYPFNLYTTELANWDPNLIEAMETESNRVNRQMLEDNLYDFMEVTMGGETLFHAGE